VGQGHNTTTTAHPLDPLSADEMRLAVATVRAHIEAGGRWRFASIELREPGKAVVSAFTAGGAIDRVAQVICWNCDDGRAYRAHVSLADESLASWEELPPGTQPNMTVDEFHDCDEAIRRDPRLIEALRSRGITDMALVIVDVWNYGDHLIPERFRGRRLGWADLWYRASAEANPYANPVNGLHCIIDLNAMELLELEDTFVVDAPATMGEYVPRLVPGQTMRDDVRPLEIVQPDGVSFTLEGNLLCWQRWSLRVGFNYREGLVLHTVGYEDGGRVRPVAHRLSLAEMVVPYRDPTTDHYRRTAFDIGEWGLGFMTVPLELGCDCLGEIVYLDAVTHDSQGVPSTIKDAICIHEEDNAVLWKHVDPVSGSEVRRMRRFVVSFHAVVANYDYIVYWRFYQDGNIECEVRATGIMVTTKFPVGQQPPYGTLVAEQTYAPTHQHFIVARLDLDVDGEQNTVLATESEVPPIGPDNPHGLAVVQRSTPLRTEEEGKQDFNWDTQRSWKVVNESVANGFGMPVGYKLVPGGSFPAMLDPASPVLCRAQVIGHTLWVTPFAQDERWPCGEFPVQAPEDTGLPAWTAANRSIENTDVVLWYVFGLHHVTRPEEWPVMPADVVSFWLKPFGFFDRNPSLDVPPNPPAHGAACH